MLVKVKVVSLNYRDLNIASGRFRRDTKEGVIPGSDASCEIVKVGSSVTDIEVGNGVITSFYPETLFGPISAVGAGRDGVLSHYKAVSRYAINKISNNSHLTHEEVSVLVCIGVTTWIAITALILAKAASAVTIITSSSDANLKYIKEKYGLDHTINYKTNPDWENKVLEITNGEGVDFINK